jgi:hypothetical protein
MIDFILYSNSKTYTSYLGQYTETIDLSATGNSPYTTYFSFESNSNGGSYMYNATSYLKIYNRTTGSLTANFKSDSYYQPGANYNIASGQTVYFRFTNQNGFGGFDDSSKNPITFDLVVNTPFTSGTDVSLYYSMEDIGNSGNRNEASIIKVIRGGFRDLTTSTPTPTVTPTPGYCGNYEYQNYSGDPVVGFSGVSTYAGECIGIIPNFSINMPANEYTDITSIGIPAVEVCPVYVDLGEIKFLDLTIPNDIFILPVLAFVLWLIIGL